jgi:dTDP-4-amino-4,6-dideoxygalactose transaminase
MELSPGFAPYLERAVAEGGSGNAPVVHDLEDAFATFMEAQFALCVASGTSALIAACHAVGVRPGDLVGVSALGPVMSGQAIAALGARPVFLDSSTPSSFGVSVTAAARAVERRVKAVILVPMWGYWDEEPDSLTLFRDSGVPVIVDAAQAPFLRLDGGLVAHAAVVCLSLHSRKPLHAGEGGVCLTNHRHYAERILSVRNFGQDAALESGHLVPRGPFGSRTGVNLKMNALGAAWCLYQTDRLDQVRDGLARLRECALEAFGSSDALWHEASLASAVIEHGRYGIVAICDSIPDAARLTDSLVARGIEVDTKRFEYQPMYAAQCFRRMGASCPMAEQLTRVAVGCRLEACWRHPCLRIFRQGSLLIERQSWMWMVANPSQHSRGDADAIRSATEAGMSPW